MTTTNINAVIPCDLHTVWDAFTDIGRYPEWRSNVINVEKRSEKQFLSYSADGYATAITITAAEPDHHLELDMESSHTKEHWTIRLNSMGSETALEITACAEAKHLTARPVGKSVFEREYLKKEQERLVSDLKKLLADSSD